ncbi:hypothetical protein MLD38_035187 [Melastoma candidum]|uniref:Uncharacterized protein n=1 Tax=Melastoma candidum TaxID=119954 RepID=A0ACB9MDK5_9MYRT|nr:hypothetical protein MLD38_035187 [Melastoma candidum]
MISCHNTDATAKDVVETEAGYFTGDCSQIGSDVSFEEIDGHNVTGAQTKSTDLVLYIEADEVSTDTSLECACFQPQDDAFTLDCLEDLAEENEETTKPLVDAESKEAGLQDGEERRAAEPKLLTRTF